MAFSTQPRDLADPGRSPANLGPGEMMKRIYVIESLCNGCRLCETFCSSLDSGVFGSAPTDRPWPPRIRVLKVPGEEQDIPLVDCSGRLCPSSLRRWHPHLRCTMPHGRADLRGGGWRRGPAAGTRSGTTGSQFVQSGRSLEVASALERRAGRRGGLSHEGT